MPKHARKPPAIADRPRCAECDKTRTPVIEHDYSLGSLHPKTIGWTGRYYGYGHFCTLRCCARYANRTRSATFGEPPATRAR